MAEKIKPLPEPLPREEWDFSQYRKIALQGIFYYEFCRSTPAIVELIEQYRKHAGISVKEIRENIKFFENHLSQLVKIIADNYKWEKSVPGDPEKFYDDIKKCQKRWVKEAPFFLGTNITLFPERLHECWSSIKNKRTEIYPFMKLLMDELPPENSFHEILQGTTFVNSLRKWAFNHTFPECASNSIPGFVKYEATMLLQREGYPQQRFTKLISVKRDRENPEEILFTFEDEYSRIITKRLLADEAETVLELHIPTIHPSVLGHIFEADWAQNNTVLRNEFEEFLQHRPKKYNDLPRFDRLGFEVM